MIEKTTSKVYIRLLYGFDGELLEEESYSYAGSWARASEDLGEPDAGGDAGADVLGTIDYSDPGDVEEESAPAEPEGDEEEGEDAEAAPEEPEKKEPKGKKAAKGKEPVKEEPAEEPEAKAEPKEEPAAAPEPAKAEPPTQAASTEPQKTPQEMRDELVGEIESRYSFTEEETELLQTDPAKVLPRLAARLYVDVYEALYYGTMSQMPQMITAIQRQTSDAESKMGRFYEAFPELKDPKYGQTLAQVGHIWRQNNPNATEDEAIAGVGNAAMAFLGIQREAPPSAPATPEPEQPKTRMPSTPAAARVGGAQVEQPPVQNDILDMLDFEMSDD